MNSMFAYFLFDIEKDAMIEVQQLTIGIDAELCKKVIFKSIIELSTV